MKYNYSINNNFTPLIKAAIEYGRMQAFSEIPVPKQFKEYSNSQLSKAANALQATALDNDYLIEFNGNEFKAIRPIKGELDK